MKNKDTFQRERFDCQDGVKETFPTSQKSSCKNLGFNPCGSSSQLSAVVPIGKFPDRTRDIGEVPLDGQGRGGGWGGGGESGGSLSSHHIMTVWLEWFLLSVKKGGRWKQ